MDSVDQKETIEGTASFEPEHLEYLTIGKRFVRRPPQKFSRTPSQARMNSLPARRGPPAVIGSYGRTSFLCVAMYQTLPKGSFTYAVRSP